MNDMIVYHPYKMQTWLLVFIIPIGTLAFLGAGYCLTFSGSMALCLVGIGILCTWLAKILYVSSGISVILEQNGLHIISGSCRDCRNIPWKKLPYSYHTTNYKGHMFLVLSPNVLSPKDVKRFANREAILSRVCIDNVVVIYIDRFQNVSELLVKGIAMHSSSTG